MGPRAVGQGSGPWGEGLRGAAQVAQESVRHPSAPNGRSGVSQAVPQAAGALPPHWYARARGWRFMGAVVDLLMGVLLGLGGAGRAVGPRGAAGGVAD